MLTENSALGTPPDSHGDGVSAHMHRRILRYHWDNPGIVGQDPHDLSLLISGRDDMSYDVTRGLCVLPRDDSWSEGFYEAYVDKCTVGPVAGGDPSNPRIDVIWIRANDLDFDDRPEGKNADGSLLPPTNRIEVGVTQGTPAKTPAEPAIPERAWRLGAMLVPAGATKTASATPYGDIDYATPYGAEMGIIARVAENKDGQASSNPPYKNPILNHTAFFPTDRNILLHAYLCVSTPTKTSSHNTRGVAAVQFYVDGEKYTTRKVEYTEAWVTHEVTASIQVPAGRHTFGLAMYNEEGNGYVTHFSHNDPDDRGNYYVGRVLVIKDEGVAR